MTEILARNRAVRAGNRGVVTKLIKEGEQHIKHCNESQQSEWDTGRMQTICALLDEKKEILKELDKNIIDSCEITDIEKEIDEAAILSRILDIQRLLREKYNTTVTEGSKASLPPQTQLSTPSSSSIPSTTQYEGEGTSTGTLNSEHLQTLHISNNEFGASTSTTDSVATQSQPVTQQLSQRSYSKLPKLVLPKFKGDITQFRSFWDSFESAVHKNPGLSTVDKFNYLNSLLEGRALRAVQGLPVTEGNYQSAVDILQQRFGKSQAIISAHMEELMKILACGDKPSQMRYVYDKVSVHVRGLESLGVNSEQYGSLLIPVIMAKLPSDVRVQIARCTTQDVWKIDALLDIILKEVEARELSDSVKVSDPDPRKPRTPSAQALATQGVPGKSITCVYCREHHYSASCDRITNPNERKEVLKRDRRCFVCLGKNHRSAQCDPKRRCRRCGGGHHQSICDKSIHPNPPNPPKPPVKPADPPPSKEGNPATENELRTSTTTVIDREKVTTTATKSHHQVFLQTAVTYAKSSNDSSEIPVRVLLDSGSQRSYITSSLKRRLGLPTIKTETLNLNTFGDDNYTTQRCDMVQLSLKGKTRDRKITALCFPKICSPLTTTLDLSRYPHLQGLELSDLNILKGQPVDSNIDILLGADYYFEILTGEIVRGEGGPIAINSEFGWVICGPTSNPGTEKGVSRVNLLIETQCSLSVPGSLAARNDEPELSKSLRQFWETESLGIQEEEEFKEAFSPDIKFNDSEGRYEVTLPWKTDYIPKSSGYAMCTKRLRQLHSRLKSDTPLLREYDTIIKEQEKMGIIEPVVDNNDVLEPGHFLPHHAVVRKDKETTKVRVVFDGSAKSSKEDLSLNDCLERGPNLVPHLFDTIVKFRGYPVGLIADIEKAFHQILISPDDRKMLRFLWFDDIFQDYPIIKVYQFCRLPFGLTPSPAVLATTIRHHLSTFKKKEPEVVSLLSESLYVDDFASGANEDDEAVRIQRTSKRIMKEGGFTLRKWYSNSPYVRKIIAAETDPNSTEEQKQPSELATTRETRTCSQPTKQPSANLPEPPSQLPSSPVHSELPPVCYVKLLGINWNFESDEFCYNLQEMVEYAQSLPSTKRSVLKLSAKVFDPIGLVTPFTVNMKILFQSLCTDDVKWDDDLEGEALSRWNKLVNELHALNDVRVPRCYFQCVDQLPRKHQLHGFCDASDLALAAVVYLRTEHSDGRVNVNLVASKSRVAPIKKQTTPRLELLGATILARLIKSIVRVLVSLKLDLEVILWTDSFTVLCWIRNNRAWKPYVQNRVKEIREITCEYEWRHCPGKHNPADIPSRGCTGNELAESQLWWNGPKFLTCSRDQWPPELQPTSLDLDQANLETMKNPPLIIHSLSGMSSSAKNVIQVEKIIDIRRYSTKVKLLRVTARVIRFLRITRKTLRISSSELSANELHEAEILWLHCIQSSCFQEEIRCIHNGCCNAKVTQLGMFIDEDNIIRCEGRTNEASVPEPAKRPILLPTRHAFTELIIRESHEIVHHNGVRETLNCVRGRFWVLRGREAVKRIVRRCVTCRKFEGKPFPTPKDPPLPPSRVSDQPPFTHTGIDFAGPLYATTNQTTRKVYYVSLPALQLVLFISN